MIGTLLISVGRVQVDPRALQLLVLAGSPFWLAHDVIVGSPLIIADVLGLTIGVVTLIRRTSVRPPSPDAWQAPFFAGALQSNGNLTHWV